MDTTDTSKDEYLRKEFAKAFGWWIERDVMYARYDNSDRKPRTPTWEEIFIEVGQLLNRSQTLTDTHHLNAIEHRLNGLEERFTPLNN